ncbi:MAG: hypothetical protein KAT07_03090, partial [Calditrichia bacterium]|nr:hypothetical protein [Calditrichia bacterium]
FVNGIIYSLDFFLYRHCERSARLASRTGSNPPVHLKKRRLLRRFHSSRQSINYHANLIQFQ